MNKLNILITGGAGYIGSHVVKQLLESTDHPVSLYAATKKSKEMMAHTYSQRSLAKEIGYSVGKVNYILNALMEKGLVKAESFLNAQNKRKYSYLLTEKGIKEKMTLTKKFVERKKAEYETLQRELEMYEMSIQTQGKSV